MTRRQLILRGLTFYWRTHLAVVAGVATAVAVLAGALLVGDSVRGSLRAIVLDRLGATHHVVASAGFFRDALAAEVEGDPAFQAAFAAAAPLIAIRGAVTAQDTGRRVGRAAVYGVDDRFWRFHGVADAGLADREALLSPALAAALGAAEGDAVVVRVQRPTDAPLESLHGRKDDLGRALRLTVAGVQPREALGEFSLELQQSDVQAVFVPLSRLQREIGVDGRVNVLLVSAGAAAPAGADLQAIVSGHATLDDLGLRVRSARDGSFLLESDAGLLDDWQAASARVAIAATAGVEGGPVFTYVANALRVGGREVPYSLVTAMDLARIAPGLADVGGDAIVLTRWAADDLGARVGDTLTIEYYVWEDPGRLATRTADLRVAGIVPLAPDHRDLAPTYPGISDSPSLDDWDPPFPVDLRRIRPRDEAFWQEYRTTPKAYLPLDTGQRLWQSRYGAMTGMRMTSAAEDAPERFAEALRAVADPAALGLAVHDVRAAALDASRGATDFGEYFVYFSFFLVVSALVLASLFFTLGVEQRAREVGLLRAVGLGPSDVRWLFLGEGLLLAAAGSALGVIGALGYGWLLMFGLRTWWVEAVGTTALALHVRPASLAAGAAGGLLAAVACIWWALRALDRISERALLAGELTSDAAQPLPASRTGRGIALAGVAFAAIGAGLLLAGTGGWLDPAGAFFGAGFSLLAASLCAFALLLRRRPARPIQRDEWQPLSRLGLRNATYRPGRSVRSVAVIACATFILVSVDAFRRDGHGAGSGPDTGLGGYALVAETVLPIVHDPNTREGREALGLYDLDDAVVVEPFRLRPGDDASCLNLYAPANPRILAPRDSFRQQGRFQFAGSLAATDAERANPWLLLDREEPGVVPVIGDANSMTYVLHRAVGDEMVITHGGREIRLRFVAALRDSIFQRELLMSQAHFLRLFPELEGHQVLLIEAPPDQAAALETTIERTLSDLGADVATTGDRLAQFHRVENTYLSTFQTLGGLGLLLGTVGLAAVVLRNVLERRRELALLSAVGYRRSHVLALILAENALLLAGGLAIGAICAGLAIAPTVAERGGRLPLSGGGAMLLAAVLAAGLVSSMLAMRAATRAPLLASLRSE